jgi:hypothetical protein
LRRAWKRGRKLNIDHDHQTDRVRGLLCDPCNRNLRDDFGWFMAKTAYLLYHRLNPSPYLWSKFTPGDRKFLRAELYSKQRGRCAVCGKKER